MQTRIIGIVADAATNRLDEPDAPALHRPLPSDAALLGRLVVRSRTGAPAIAGPVLDAVHALDRSILPTATTARDGIHAALRVLRIMTSFSGMLGGIALALGVTGVSGVTAFSVEQRTSEIGVRSAVGASAIDVVRLMVSDSLKPVAIGLTVGLLIAAAAGRVLTSFLYGIGEHDPVAIATAVAVLLAAPALAAVVPTRRATPLDPVTVLRHE